MRWAAGMPAGLALVLFSISAQARSPTANEKAYTLALTCAVVAAHYDDLPGTRKSQDAVKRVGRVLGYSSDRQASNMLTTASVLGVEARRDPSGMERHRGECRYFGLVS